MSAPVYPAFATSTLSDAGRFSRYTRPWVEAFDPKLFRDRSTERARELATKLVGRLADVHRTRIQRAVSRDPGARNTATLIAALDLVVGMAVHVGRHEGPGIVPAFEFTHPVYRAWSHKRASMSWNTISRALARLDAYGVVRYRPGRGRRPSVVALPAMVEEQPERWRKWIGARLAFDGAKRKARRCALLALLTGERIPSEARQDEGLLARAVATDYRTWLRTREEKRAAKQRAERARKAPKQAPTPLRWGDTEKVDDARAQGFFQAVRDPIDPDRPIMGACSTPHSSASLRSSAEASYEGEAAPAALRAPPTRRRGLAGAMDWLYREAIAAGTVLATSQGGEVRNPQRRARVPDCERCEDTGELARVASTLPPKPCPDCYARRRRERA